MVFDAKPFVPWQMSIWIGFTTNILTTTAETKAEPGVIDMKQRLLHQQPTKSNSVYNQRFHFELTTNYNCNVFVELREFCDNIKFYFL